MDSALEHLKNCDPILARAMEKVGPLEVVDERPKDLFAALCRIIVGQQLSVAVARAIWNRVETHFGEITPDAVLGSDAVTLRGLGLSGAKASYLQSLATHISEGKLKIDELETLCDEEIKAGIVAVKGLGPWSADMFLMFTLQKPDVLPVGDLGIREAMRRLYDLESRPLALEMEKISAPWRPFRTFACRYLWRVLDEKN